MSVNSKSLPVALHSGGSTAAFLWQIFWLTVLVVALPNILMHVLGQAVFISRAWVNLDYFLVAATAVLIGIGSLRIFLTAALLLDVMFSVAPAWHFSVESALQSLTDIFHLPATYWLPIALSTIAGTLLVSEVTMRTLRVRTGLPRSQARIWIAGLIVLLGGCVAGADVMAPQSRASEYFLGENVNVAGSGLNNLHVAAMTRVHGDGSTVGLEAAATAQLHRTLVGNPEGLSRRIMLVLVESWGLFRNEGLNQVQLEPLRKVLDRHPQAEVHYGKVPYKGSTVAAELRELCKREVTSTHPIVVPFADECLPALLKSQGYSTKAVHGFSPALFSRNRWYAELDFEEVVFAPDLMKAGITKRCGFVFPGICDTSVWNWLLGVLPPDERQFVYWLTLSGHLPLPAEPGWLVDDTPRCPAALAQQKHGAICDLIRVHRDLFAAIANSVEQGMLADTFLIIVGDHAPPFLEPELRAMFDDGEVPYVVVKFPWAD